MENLRLFLIRLLQAAWVFTAFCAVSTMFAEGFMYFFGALLMIGVPLVLIQFLLFSRLNPYELFSGRIKENLQPKVNN